MEKQIVMVTDYLFYFLSFLVIGSAISCVVSKHMMNAAISLIVLFVSLSGIFILLDAYLLALMQALVYAGGVMVLFVFAIMFIRPTQLSKNCTVAPIIGSVLGLIVLMVSSCYLLVKHGIVLNATHREVVTFSKDITDVSMFIFSKYMLLFQMGGLLILGSIVGIGTISHAKLDQNGRVSE